MKNKVDSCKQTKNAVFEGNIVFEKHHGFLIYALIKAINEEQAREKAQNLIDNFDLKG